MNHNAVNEHVIQLKQFRQEVYQSFNKRADTLMDLLDALSSNTSAQTVVELSLSPFFRRTYSALFTALDEWQPEKSAKSLAQLAAPYLPQPAQLPFWLVGTDVTPQPRLHARTLEDRSAPLATANAAKVKCSASPATPGSECSNGQLA